MTYYELVRSRGYSVPPRKILVNGQWKDTRGYSEMLESISASMMKLRDSFVALGNAALRIKA